MTRESIQHKGMTIIKLQAIYNSLKIYKVNNWWNENKMIPPSKLEIFKHTLLSYWQADFFKVNKDNKPDLIYRKNTTHNI